MNSLSNAIRGLLLSCLLGLSSIWIACETPSAGSGASVNQTTRPTGKQDTSFASTDILRPGDVVIVTFSGTSDPPNKTEDKIREDGTITLPFIGDVKAAGKNRSQLQADITSKYIPTYYRRLTVNVNSDLRYFTVQGEVKKPDRYPYVGRVTVLHAITTAGDFTDFANRKKVQIIRSNGKTETVNCVRAQQNPDLDITIYPDDRIFVPRRLF